MCSIDGCERPIHVQSRGWCRAHYLRWHRFGDPLASAPRKDGRTRYLEKVERLGPDDCWSWRGAVTGGRGRISWNGKPEMATRIGWELEYGYAPGELHVCHTCDHPWCHNPRHWFLGTHQDNMADLKAKNLPRGRPIATTPDVDMQIEEALATGESRMSIARRLGIGRSIVDRQARGERNFKRAPAPQRTAPPRST